LFELFSGPKPTTPDEATDRLVEQWRLLVGEATDFDAQVWATRARRWVERGQNVSCPHIHLGPQVFGIDRADQLAQMSVPTAILHGTDDPMFPPQHALAIDALLPCSSLDLYEGLGHELVLHREVGLCVAQHVTEYLGRTIPL